MKLKYLNLALLPLPLVGVTSMISCGNKSTSDRDYDGLYDYEDEEPDNNVITYRYQNFLSLNDDYTADDTFAMDYRYFVDLDPNTYHKEMAKILLPSCCDVYDHMDMQYKKLDGTYVNSYEEPNFWKRIGLKDITDINLFEETYTKDTRDLLYSRIGHHEFEYKNKKYQVFIIAIRGTLSMEETASNFDIGIDNSSYSKDLPNDHPDWINHDHHKGFDVMTNRTYKHIEKYIQQHKLTDHEEIVGITGHSRGGSAANLLGKIFEDKGIKNFTYAFAPANVAFNLSTETIDKYKNIHNICNASDFVPIAATSEIGFRKYGQTYTWQLQGFQEEYERLVPNWSVNFINPKSLEEILAAEIVSRDNLYKLPTKAEASTYETYDGYDDEETAKADYDRYKAQLEECPTLANFYDITEVESYIDEEGETKYRFYILTDHGFLLEYTGIATENLFKAIQLSRFIRKFIPFITTIALDALKVGVLDLIRMHQPQSYMVLINNYPLETKK